jgi:hypothetical protein
LDVESTSNNVIVDGVGPKCFRTNLGVESTTTGISDLELEKKNILRYKVQKLHRHMSELLPIFNIFSKMKDCCGILINFQKEKANTSLSA